MGAMIEVRGLTKAFDSHNVLDNLSFSVETAQTKVIIGRSGCGKSVLLKHIIGIIKPDAGSVFIDSLDITGLNARQMKPVLMRIGMVFQAGALFDSLTVADNVSFGLVEHFKMSPQEVSMRVDESLSMVGLRGKENRMPAQLSGGMKKRVALARALCIKPQIMLYDEPTSGIDPITADSMNELIRSLHDRLKVTSVVVTHDMKSAYRVADSIAMLYDGKIIAEGTPQQIQNVHHPLVQQFVRGLADGPISDPRPDLANS